MPGTLRGTALLGHGLASRLFGALALCAWLGVGARGRSTGLIAAGFEHSLGLRSDGSITAWGDHSSGQCSIPVPNTGFVAVGAGLDHSVAIRADGSIIASGLNNEGQCNVPAPNTDF